jgi:hypothetical protein
MVRFASCRRVRTVLVVTPISLRAVSREEEKVETAKRPLGGLAKHAAHNNHPTHLSSQRTSPARPLGPEKFEKLRGGASVWSGCMRFVEVYHDLAGLRAFLCVSGPGGRVWVFVRFWRRWLVVSVHCACGISSRCVAAQWRGWRQSRNSHACCAEKTLFRACLAPRQEDFVM